MIGVASRIILRARQQWWPGLDSDSKGWGKVGTCFLAAFLSTLIGAAIGTALACRAVVCRTRWSPLADASLHADSP